MAWVFIGDSYFGFDHHPKSTKDILRYRYWQYLHKAISRRLQILYSMFKLIFMSNSFSGAMTYARITLTFSILPPCIKLWASKVLDAKTKHEMSKRLWESKVTGPQVKHQWRHRRQREWSE